MSPDDPRHGTAWGYTVHTRQRIPACRPCKDAKSAADRRRRKMKSQGKLGRQPLGPRVYARLAEAKLRNVSNYDIAAAAGISESTVDRLVRLGPDTIVATKVKARLAVMPDPTPEITGIGYARRLRALACYGYSAADFAREAGIDIETVKKARRRPPRAVKREVRQTILDTYARLCLKPRTETDRRNRAVITLTKNIARREGWAPPLAWDDIDNPSEQPADWQYRAQTRREQFLELDASGAGVTEACGRLHISRPSLQKWAERNQLNAAYSRMVARETAIREHNNQHTKGAAA